MRVLAGRRNNLRVQLPGMKSKRPSCWLVTLVLLALLLPGKGHALECPIPQFIAANAAPILEVPTSRAAAKAMRKEYLKEIKEAISDLKELVDTSHPERNTEKITKVRKFFVMFRHYSELYTKEGKLPKSVEKLAFLPGKIVDAATNNNLDKAGKFIDRLDDALSKEGIKQILKDAKSLTVESESGIRKNIENSVQEIRNLSEKGSLSYEEFHDMKKAIRRFFYLQKYRIKIRGETQLKEAAKVQSELIALLSKTTDDIAAMKLEIERDELAKIPFTVSPEIRDKISAFIGSLRYVSDF